VPTVSFDGHHYESPAGETILETLLRHGALLPSKCKTGTCRTCMVRVVAGSPPEDGQEKLRDTMVAQGFILPCMAHASSDIVLAHVDVADHEVMLTVAAKTRLSADTVALRFSCPEKITYRPGQHINLVRPSDQRVCSYNLASIPDDEFLEIHVKTVPGGNMSAWLTEELAVGDKLGCYGPAGDCFFLPNRPDGPLLLVAIESGLAGIYGILRDALGHGHTSPPIHLIHAAADANHYLDAALERLGAQHGNVNCHTCTADPAEIASAIKAVVADLAGWRIYVCGPMDGVKAARKHAFLGGAKMGDIYTVSFGS